MSKKLPAIILMSTLGAAAALAFLAPQSAEAGETTDCEKVKDGKVKAFCKAKSGKQSDIKKAMKAWQKAVNDKGMDPELKCGSCHEDGTSVGPLKPEAGDLWKKAQALVPFSP